MLIAVIEDSKWGREASAQTSLQACSGDATWTSSVDLAWGSAGHWEPSHASRQHQVG
jgi:hypothetical protein